jgi:hypothetical protein
MRETLGRSIRNHVARLFRLHQGPGRFSFCGVKGRLIAVILNQVDVRVDHGPRACEIARIRRRRRGFAAPALRRQLSSELPADLLLRSSPTDAVRRILLFMACCCSLDTASDDCYTLAPHACDWPPAAFTNPSLAPQTAIANSRLTLLLHVRLRNRCCDTCTPQRCGIAHLHKTLTWMMNFPHLRSRRSYRERSADVAIHAPLRGSKTCKQEGARWTPRGGPAERAEGSDQPRPKRS